MAEPPPRDLSNIQIACNAVHSGQMNVYQASKEYGIAKSTLYDKVKGISPLFTKKGPMCVLSDYNEKLLVEWIKICGKAGFPTTKTQVLLSVASLVKSMNIKTPFVNGSPGRRWYENFMKRHPELSLRTPQNLTLSRAKVTEELLRSWFAEVKKGLEEGTSIYHALDEEPKSDSRENSDSEEDPEEFILGDERNCFEILNDPSRVFNMDELAIFYNPKGDKVIFKKGAKNVYTIINVDEKECVTVLISVNSAGTVAPPMVVLTYQRVPKAIADAIPQNWGIGNSNNGWMTAETFYEYIANVFEPWLTEMKIERPVIIFLDGHVSHLTLHLSKFCYRKKIIIVALLANSTHLVQPLDVACFKALKHEWLEVANQFRFSTMQPVITKTEFFPLLQIAMDGAFTESTIRSGFRKCGLIPWNPNALDYSKIRAEPVLSDTPVPINAETTAPTTAAPTILQDVQAPLKHLNAFLGSEKEEFFFTVRSASDWMDLVDEMDHSLFNYWRHTFAVVSEESSNHMAQSTLAESTDQSKTPSAEVTPTHNENNIVPQNDFPAEEEEPEILTLLGDLIDYESIVPLTSPQPAIRLPQPSIAQTVPLSRSALSVSPEHSRAPSSLQIHSSQEITAKPLALSDRVIESSALPNATEDFSKPSTSKSGDIILESSTHTPKSSASSSPLALPLPPTRSPKSHRKTPTKSSSKPKPQFPSPFKRAVPWPGERRQDKINQLNKKVKRVLIPVITSDKWREFHEKEQKAKEAAEAEKSRKREERENKRNELTERKMKRTAAVEERKKKRLEEMEEKKKTSLKDKSAVTTKKPQISRKRKAPSPAPLEDQNSDQEDEIGSIKSLVQVDNYVIVHYEGEFFPGMVLKREEDKVSVKTMAMAGIDVWKWPLKDDICDYEYDDVRMVINQPQPFNNRGHFKVPEIKKFK